MQQWQCPLASPELLDADQLREVDPPFPGLVVIGATDEDELVLVDVEYVGVLHLTGPARYALARSMAVEMAVTQLADHLTVAVPASIAPGLAEVCERLRPYADLDALTGMLRTHHLAQQEALAALGLAGLHQARLREAGVGGWTPIVAFTDTASAADLEQVRQVIEEEPRTSTAVIVTDDASQAETSNGWVLHLQDEHTPLQLPGVPVLFRPHVLTGDAYEDIVQLLTTAEADHDLPAPPPAPHVSVADRDEAHASPHTEPSTSAPYRVLPDPRGEPAAEGHGEGGESPSTQETPGQEPATHPAALPTSVRGPHVIARLADLEDDADEDSSGQHDAAAVPEEPSADPRTTFAVESADINAGMEEVDRPEPAGQVDTPTRAAAPKDDAAIAPPVPEQPQQDLSQPAPHLRVLGTVEVAGARGDLEAKRTRTATELVAWLVFHPHSTRQALEDALWRGRAVKRRTVTELISRTRAWLGSDEDGYYFPVIADSGRYALHRVTSDWHQFQSLVARGESTSGPTGTRALREALELVRDRPFSGTQPTRYAWAESLMQEMISAIVDAAELLAERYRVDRSPREALWAASKGLQAAPEAEQLHRQKFQALAALGDTEGLKRAADELDALNEALGEEAEDSTIETLRALLAST